MDDFKIIQFKNDNVELSVNVSPSEDTVWLTIEQMSILFSRDRSVISRHINNIYKEGELDKNTSMHFLHVSNNNPKNRPPELYNLNVIISVGYRVKSKNDWYNKNNDLTNKDAIVESYADMYAKKYANIYAMYYAEHYVRRENDNF